MGASDISSKAWCRVASHRRRRAGHGGFEWDDVFIPEGQNQTFAQLGTQKNGLSMRRRALDAFVTFLRES
jgi:inosine/xanthosine triphosphate pyrophosphatase family protein